MGLAACQCRRICHWQRSGRNEGKDKLTIVVIRAALELIKPALIPFDCFTELHQVDDVGSSVTR